MIACEDLRLANCLFEAEFREAFERVLASGRYISGPELEALEVSFSEALGLGRSVGLVSGYDAITISFMALSITGGEVIVPANTYMATILAAIRAGLKPVLCEPDPETLLIDPARLERHLTKRTVALLPVHLYGLACDMDTLNKISCRSWLSHKGHGIPARMTKAVCLGSHRIFFETNHTMPGKLRRAKYSSTCIRENGSGPCGSSTRRRSSNPFLINSNSRSVSKQSSRRDLHVMRSKAPSRSKGLSGERR